MRFVLVGNPGSLRLEAFRRELAARGVAETVVPWADVVANRHDLSRVSAFDGDAVLRLESPGRDWELERSLIALGRELTGDADPTDFANLPHELGRLVRPGLCYAGFREVLLALSRHLSIRPNLRAFNDPAEAAEMFSKDATHLRLEAAGIAVPERIPPVAGEDAAGLLARLRAGGHRTVYAKLDTGSSAAAIAVVRPHRDPPDATSSMLLRGGEFFSSRLLSAHRGEGLEAVLAFLLREGLHMQAGIRLARIDGENMDVRVVTIGGRPAFTVFRLSPHPMTNLHLGGRRGDAARCRAAIPTRAWLDAMDDCVRTAALYRSAMTGIDVAFEEGYRRHAILEVNAFGDFFPGLTDGRGVGVHGAEVEWLAGE